MNSFDQRSLENTETLNPRSALQEIIDSPNQQEEADISPARKKARSVPSVTKSQIESDMNFFPDSATDQRNQPPAQEERFAHCTEQFSGATPNAPAVSAVRTTDRPGGYQPHPSQPVAYHGHSQRRDVANENRDANPWGQPPTMSTQQFYSQNNTPSPAGSSQARVTSMHAGSQAMPFRHVSAPLSDDADRGQNRNQRKIPGPAGELGPLEPGDIPLAAQPYRPISTQVVNHRHNDQQNVRPEMDLDFKQGAWLIVSDYMKELGQDLTQGSKMNIAKILDGGYKQKIPQLIVLVKACTVIGRNALLSLKDPTGEMEGTVHTEALSEHTNITIGAVLVLTKVSVFSPTPTKHHLNITLDNITMVQTPGKDENANESVDYGSQGSL